MYHFRKSHSADYFNPFSFRVNEQLEGSTVNPHLDEPKECNHDGARKQLPPTDTSSVSSSAHHKTESASSSVLSVSSDCMGFSPSIQSDVSMASTNATSLGESSSISPSASACPTSPTNLPMETDAMVTLSAHHGSEEGSADRLLSLASSSSSSLQLSPYSSSPQDRYLLETLIRESIFGKVFVAFDRLSQTPVAAKLSNLRLLRQGMSVNRRRVLENPMRECIMLQAVHTPLASPSQAVLRAITCRCYTCRHPPRVPATDSHPHVVPLLAEHMDEHVHWMVMPLQKCEFFDVVRRMEHPLRFLPAETAPSTDSSSPAPLPPFNPAYIQMDRRFRNYFRQMVSALAFVHHHRICHLDFSLENLLVDHLGDLKLNDFGVARQISSDSAEPHQLPGYRHEKPGKLRYMAPEVLLGLPFNGFQADMFALGVTLFCMLTAHLPFEVPTHSDVCFHMLASGQLRQLVRLLNVEPVLGDSACDLMQKLLWGTPSARITLEELQSHPYYVYDDEEQELFHAQDA